MFERLVGAASSSAGGDNVPDGGVQQPGDFLGDHGRGVPGACGLSGEAQTVSLSLPPALRGSFKDICCVVLDH